jgi:hypothetical protein
MIGPGHWRTIFFVWPHIEEPTEKLLANQPPLKPCPECACLVMDTPEKWAAHRERIHQPKIMLTRLATTKEATHYNKRKLSEDEEILCEACRGNNCLACDGGDYRCVCALELDEIKHHLKPR